LIFGFDEMLVLAGISCGVKLYRAMHLTRMRLATNHIHRDHVAIVANLRFVTVLLGLFPNLMPLAELFFVDAKRHAHRVRFGINFHARLLHLLQCFGLHLLKYGFLLGRNFAGAFPKPKLGVESRVASTAQQASCYGRW
jgi:hypothetical protein